MTTPDVAVAILCLVIFSILGIAFTPIAIWHGPKGGALIGWGNLVLFCAIRMSGMITQIIDPSSRWIVVIQYVSNLWSVCSLSSSSHAAKGYLTARDALSNGAVTAIYSNLC